jgi:hypothetical protein
MSIDYTKRTRVRTAVIDGKRTVVNVQHPRRASQTLRAAGDTSIRLVPGQSVRIA